MYDVGYAHKAGQLLFLPCFILSLAHTASTDAVYESLRPAVNLPLVMSRVDRRGNLDKRQQTVSARLDDSAANTAVFEGEEGQAERNTTPADGISDLPPAPTPEGLVPSDALPAKPDPPRVSYDLPDGIETIEECAIFYLGGESLALNNLLMTHGRCSVRDAFNCAYRMQDHSLTGPARLQVYTYDPSAKEARLESGKTNRMLMRRYAVVEKAKDADVIGILVGTLGVCESLSAPS
jgi:diphthamide biosynthesis protein 2